MSIYRHYRVVATNYGMVEDNSFYTGKEWGEEQIKNLYLKSHPTVQGYTYSTDSTTIIDGLNKKIVSPTVTGNATFENNVIVSGDLTVQGTTTTIDTTNTEIKDNIILLNNGEVGAGVTAGTAGFEIDRGSEANVTFLFNDATDKWTIANGTFEAGAIEAASITSDGSGDATGFTNITGASGGDITQFTNITGDSGGTISGFTTLTGDSGGTISGLQLSQVILVVILQALQILHPHCLLAHLMVQPQQQVNYKVIGLYH